MTDFQSVKTGFGVAAIAYGLISLISFLVASPDLPFRFVALVFAILFLGLVVVKNRKRNPFYRLDPAVRKAIVSKYRWGNWTLIPFGILFVGTIVFLSRSGTEYTPVQLIYLGLSSTTLAVSICVAIHLTRITRKFGYEVFD